MIAALLFVAALSADPAAAPVADPIARPAPIADTDLREFAAIAGRKVAGRPVLSLIHISEPTRPY